MPASRRIRRNVYSTMLEEIRRFPADKKTWSSITANRRRCSRYWLSAFATGGVQGNQAALTELGSTDLKYAIGE